MTENDAKILLNMIGCCKKSVNGQNPVDGKEAWLEFPAGLCYDTTEQDEWSRLQCRKAAGEESPGFTGQDAG